MSNKNIQQSKITVEKNNVIGRIGQNLFGAFLEHVGRAIYTGIYELEHPTANKDGFRTDVIELVKELHVPLFLAITGRTVSATRLTPLRDLILPGTQRKQIRWE